MLESEIDGQRLLQRFVDEIESNEDEVKERNEQKSAVYKEAKTRNCDAKAMKQVIAIQRRRRQDGGPEGLDEHDRKVSEHLDQMREHLSKRLTPAA
ncbi:GapR family DNA-binding domain-containing protein [Rhizobium sp. NXC24]|uniref:GapR family DNA-binding domain-containing protein n=1 Tax=Rhizobium sp. NXC24 TaxID=2048897 RepID=UPI000CDF54D0|nr:GapR family DNA-binding domain-containing protein [Rhizobium sp. NXC24]AVA23814.1 hypothetical protein NXC24_PA00168 [Rhizobium sp. NXC24]